MVFLWEKDISIKCHENVMKFQCHSMGLNILVQFDGIFVGKFHGIVMEFDSFSTKTPMGI